MSSLREQLTDARDAYHRLMTGAAFVEFKDGTGESIRYKPADAKTLLAYIESLERQLGTPTVRRPIGFYL